MDVIDIPFVKKVGVVQSPGDKNTLQLPADETNRNHLEMVHAAAQYTLAETASGNLLLSHFPELADTVIPLLRRSEVVYKKPAIGSLTAHPSVSDAAILKFRSRFEKKGRAVISVEVKLKNSQGEITCSCSFDWFIQAKAAKP